jgi:MFS family permease
LLSAVRSTVDNVRSLHRDVKILVFSMFLWEVGLTLYDAILPVYLRQLGAAPQQLGLVFSIAYLIVALTSLPGGWLADHFDRRRVMLFFWCVGTPSALLLGLATTWNQAMIGIILYFFSFTTFPAINAYLTDATDPARMAIAFGILYATFPLAQLVGPAIGGFLADRVGFQPLFLISFVFYALSTLAISRLAAQKAVDPLGSSLTPWKAFADRRFLRFGLLSAIYYVFLTMLLRFTSPFLVEMHGVSLTTVGLLASTAALGGILLTPLLSSLGDRLGRLRALALTAALYALYLLMLGWFTNPLVLLLAFFLQGSFFAARSLMDAVTAGFGKGRQAGLYFGAFGLLTGLGQTVAPLIGGQVYGWNPQAAFVLCAAGCALIFGIISSYKTNNAS